MAEQIDENVFKAKAREWAQAVVTLANTDVPANMEGEKRRLLNLAKTIKEKVEMVTGPLDYLAPMNQLGFVPIVIAGAVAAAASAIGYWYYDYNKFVAKINDRNTLIAGGMTPQQAANIVSQTDGGILSNVSNIAKYGAIAAIAYIAAKKMRFI